MSRTMSVQISRRRFLYWSCLSMAGTAFVQACSSTTPPAAPAPPAGAAAQQGQAPAAGAVSAAQAPATTKARTELKLWHFFTGGNNTETTNKMIQNYSETNQDGININVDVFPSPDLVAKYRAAVRAGNAPDIIYFPGRNLADFASSGLLLELSDDLQKEVGAFPMDDQYPAAQQNGMYKNKRWAISLDLLSRTFYYRGDHAKEAGLDPTAPPRTREDWLAWAKKLQTPAHFGTGLPAIGNFISITAQFRNTLWFQNRVKYYTDDLHKAAINTPQAAEVLKWLAQVINHENVTSPTIQDPRQDFLKVNVSSYPDGAFIIPLLVDNKVPFFTVRYPKFFADDIIDISSNMAGITNSKDKDKIAAASKYHQWVLKHPVEYFNALGTVPANKTYAESAEFKSHPWYPYMKPHLDSLPTAIPYPQHELSTKLESANAFDVGMQQVLSEKISPEDGLARLEKEWNDILADMPS